MLKKSLLFIAVGAAVSPIWLVAIVIAGLREIGKVTCETFVRSWSAAP